MSKAISSRLDLKLNPHPTLSIFKGEELVTGVPRPREAEGEGGREAPGEGT